MDSTILSTYLYSVRLVFRFQKKNDQTEVQQNIHATQYVFVTSRVCSNGYGEFNTFNTTTHVMQRRKELAFLNQTCSFPDQRRLIPRNITIGDFVLKFFGNRVNLLSSTSKKEFFLPHIRNSLSNSNIVRFLKVNTPVEILQFMDRLDSWCSHFSSVRARKSRAFESCPITNEILDYNGNWISPMDFLLHAGHHLLVATTTQPTQT